MMATTKQLSGTYQAGTSANAAEHAQQTAAAKTAGQTPAATTGGAFSKGKLSLAVGIVLCFVLADTPAAPLVIAVLGAGIVYQLVNL